MNASIATTSWRVVLGITALTFLAALAWGMTTLDVDDFRQLTREPWFVITLVDFYLGILCLTAVVHAVEASIVRAIAWGAAAAALGYPVFALWLVLRGLPRLAANAQRP